MVYVITTSFDGKIVEEIETTNARSAYYVWLKTCREYSVVPTGYQSATVSLSCPLTFGPYECELFHCE